MILTLPLSMREMRISSLFCVIPTFRRAPGFLQALLLAACLSRSCSSLLLPHTLTPKLPSLHLTLHFPSLLILQMSLSKISVTLPFLLDFGKQSGTFSLFSLMISFLFRVLSPTSDSQRSVCLCLHSAGIKGVHHGAWLLFVLSISADSLCVGKSV